MICIPTSILKDAINTFGVDNQLDKSIEEMSELIKEICKFKIKKDFSLESLSEELADVIIMVQQLQMIFGNRHKVEEYVTKKLNRLDGLIDEHKKREVGEVCDTN